MTDLTKEPFGIIKMRAPDGRKTQFAIYCTEKGSVDFIASRSSGGEVLIRFSAAQAIEVGDLLRRAALAKKEPKP